MSQEQWVSMTEASKILEVPLSQISRLAKSGEITAVKDAINKRVKLVELGQVKKIFDQSIYYQQKKQKS